MDQRNNLLLYRKQIYEWNEIIAMKKQIFKNVTFSDIIKFGN
jgi:hypothetical protein